MANLSHSHATPGRLSPNLVRHTSTPLMLFAAEGALLQFIIAINAFANNLYATSLGAGDSQIGLVQMVPNAAALLLLIPAGLAADRARSSRTVPLLAAVFVAVGFFLMAAVPNLGADRLRYFFLALAMSVGGPVLYQAQWQNFFGDAVPEGDRNRVLTLRNSCMYASGIVAPFVCTALLRGKTGAESTLSVLRLVFLGCGVFMLTLAFLLSCTRTIPKTDRMDTEEPMAQTLNRLMHSWPFLLFFIPTILFYITWQADWSVWYIGQTQYLHMTETQISAFNGVCNIGQLAAILLLASRVERRGADRVFPIAAFGLLACPLGLMFATILPGSASTPIFTLLIAIVGAPQCAVNLCIVQILLRVAPKGCRNMAISLYTLTITLTNCFMPYLGVKMYAALGSDYRALILFNTTVFLSRIVTLALLMLRVPLMKRLERQ